MRNLSHLEDSHRMARFCLSLTTWSNAEKKKNPPFLHREFEITDKSLQLWTELLNLLTPGPFWAGVTLCVCLWQKEIYWSG